MKRGSRSGSDVRNGSEPESLRGGAADGTMVIEVALLCCCAAPARLGGRDIMIKRQLHCPVSPTTHAAAGPVIYIPTYILATNTANLCVTVRPNHSGFPAWVHHQGQGSPSNTYGKHTKQWSHGRSYQRQRSRVPGREPNRGLPWRI